MAAKKKPAAAPALPAPVSISPEEARARTQAARIAALKIMERRRAAVAARDSLKAFTLLTMPDPEDVDDVNKSLYDSAWHHEAIDEVLEKVERGELLRVIITMPPRHGKLLAHSTPVLTTEGWKTHGELRVGDQVFGPDGKPTEVVWLSEEDAATLEVELSNGDFVKCHPNHEWTVFDRSRFKWRTLEAREIAGRAVNDRVTFQLQNIAPVEFAPRELVMAPYALGAWLGDGTSSKPWITHAASDVAVVEAIAANGYEVSRRYVHSVTGVVSTVFAGPRPNCPSIFWKALRALNLVNNKHIPEAYFTSSVEQRLELLAGLIDTDGSVDRENGRVMFSNANSALMADVYRLVTELGMRPYVSRYEPTKSTSGIQGKQLIYQLGFQPTMEVPCRLPRKKINRVIAQRRVGIVAVRPCAPERGRCIQVDRADGLYLVGRRLVPTHNSEKASRRFPAWFMGRDPYRQIIFATYGADFAEDFGRKVREVIQMPTYRQVFPRVSLKQGSKAADRMETDAGGMAVFIGVGGPATGRGADLLLIDDPFKNREEAESAVNRDKVWNWFTSTAYTRLMPGGRIVIILTRWHEDDIVGRIFSEDYVPKEEADKWFRLDLPAIIEEGTENERALWPTRYSLETLKSTRAFIGERDWNALYQQRPTPPEGAFFKNDMIHTYGREEYAKALKNCRKYMGGDLALGDTKKHDSSCVGVALVDENDDILISPDLYWDRKKADQSVETIIDMMLRHEPMSTWWEKGQIEKAIGPFLFKRMAERKCYSHVQALPVHGDKGARASAIRGRMSMGKVKFPKFAPWFPRAKEQMLKFTGSGDDAEDDFCDFISTIGQGLSKQLKASVPGSNVVALPKVGTLAWIKWADRMEQRREKRLKAQGGF